MLGSRQSRDSFSVSVSAWSWNLNVLVSTCGLEKMFISITDWQSNPHVCPVHFARLHSPKCLQISEHVSYKYGCGKMIVLTGFGDLDKHQWLPSPPWLFDHCRCGATASSVFTAYLHSWLPGDVHFPIVRNLHYLGICILPVCEQWQIQQVRKGMRHMVSAVQIANLWL